MPLPVKLHHLGGQELSAFQLNVTSGITSAVIFPSRRAQSVSQMGRPSLKLALMLSCVKNLSLGRMRRQFGLPWIGEPGLPACPATPRCGLGLVRCPTVRQPGVLGSAASALCSATCSLSSVAGSPSGASQPASSSASPVAAAPPRAASVASCSWSSVGKAPGDAP